MSIKKTFNCCREYSFYIFRLPLPTMTWHLPLFGLCLLASCFPKDTTKWSYKKIERYENSIKCELGSKYSLMQRRKMFPFDKAQKVLFIAFRNKELFKNSYKFDTQVMDTSRTLDGQLVILPRLVKDDGYEKKEIIKTWGFFDRDTVHAFGILPGYNAIESIELSSSQVDTLSNLLLNYRLNKSPLTSYRAGCYTPRNAILFLNEKNQIIAFIEICFECYQMKFSYSTDSEQLLESHCGSRIFAINAFFSRTGIKYGVDTKH